MPRPLPLVDHQYIAIWHAAFLSFPPPESGCGRSVFFDRRCDALWFGRLLGRFLALKVRKGLVLHVRIGSGCAAAHRPPRVGGCARLPASASDSGNRSRALVRLVYGRAPEPGDGQPAHRRRRRSRDASPGPTGLATRSFSVVGTPRPKTSALPNGPAP